MYKSSNRGDNTKAEDARVVTGSYVGSCKEEEEEKGEPISNKTNKQISLTLQELIHQGARVVFCEAVVEGLNLFGKARIKSLVQKKKARRRQKAHESTINDNRVCVIDIGRGVGEEVRRLGCDLRDLAGDSTPV